MNNLLASFDYSAISKLLADAVRNTQFPQETKDEIQAAFDAEYRKLSEAQEWVGNVIKGAY
ncbi:MAG: hypothetical protein JNL32_07645 [Candidatus Kapabacteria bacterium]|nr:hypothetical protein [Candidatus Kapabacteria bacterium]